MYFIPANTPWPHDSVCPSEGWCSSQTSLMLALLHTKTIMTMTDYKPYLTSQIAHSFLNKNGCATGAERKLSVGGLWNNGECLCVINTGSSYGFNILYWCELPETSSTVLQSCTNKSGSWCDRNVESMWSPPSNVHGNDGRLPFRKYIMQKMQFCWHELWNGSKIGTAKLLKSAVYLYRLFWNLGRWGLKFVLCFYFWSRSTQYRNLYRSKYKNLVSRYLLSIFIWLMSSFCVIYC